MKKNIIFLVSVAIVFIFLMNGVYAACSDQCVLDTKRCLKSTLYLTCVTGSNNCTKWDLPTPCDADEVCINDGLCCFEPCELDKQRCYNSTSYQTCITGDDGCPVFGEKVNCNAGEECIEGDAKVGCAKEILKPCKYTNYDKFVCVDITLKTDFSSIPDIDFFKVAGDLENNFYMLSKQPDNTLKLSIRRSGRNRVFYTEEINWSDGETHRVELRKKGDIYEGCSLYIDNIEELHVDAGNCCYDPPIIEYKNYSKNIYFEVVECGSAMETGLIIQEGNFELIIGIVIIVIVLVVIIVANKLKIQPHNIDFKKNHFR